MKRFLKIGLVVLAGAALVGGATAYARGRGHGHGGMRGEFMKRMVSARIDDALDQVKANDAQRTVIGAARDNVFASFAGLHEARAGELTQALALFEQERLDEEAVKALRQRREAGTKQIGDTVTQALLDTHDALSAEQRQQLVAYAREQHPRRRGGHGGGFMKRIAKSYLDDGLDAANATKEQRAQVTATAERAFAAFQKSHEGHAQHLARALALFESERPDPKAIQGLRDEQQARATVAAAAIEQAVRELHRTLSAEQRKALASYLRSRLG